MRPHELNIERGTNPLDTIEQVASFNDWSFERPGDDEITILIGAIWADYTMSLSWMDDIETLHLACAFDMRVPERRHIETLKLVSLINHQLLVGHFDLWFNNGMVVYRQALPLNGGIDANEQQVEFLLGNSLEACERYYQAFQFVVWAGKSASDALDSVLFETHGEA